MATRYPTKPLTAALDRIGAVNPQKVRYRVEADGKRPVFRIVLTAETPEDFPGARGVWFSGSSRNRLDGRRRWVHTAVWAPFTSETAASESLHKMRVQVDASYAASHKAAAKKAERQAVEQAAVEAYQAPIKALRAEFLSALEDAGIPYETGSDAMSSVRVNEMLWSPYDSTWFPAAPPEAAMLPAKYTKSRSS